MSSPEVQAQAQKIERQLEAGEPIATETVMWLLDSEDDELGLLASYLLAGHEEEILGRVDAASQRILERLAKRHGESLSTRFELPPLLSRQIELTKRDLPAPPSSFTAALASEEWAASMTIIVHGAFAEGDTWWRPTGNFGHYLGEITGDLYSESDFFRWSGGAFHNDRVAGARALVAWAKAHPAQELDIVSHSHGGNLCFLATQMGLRIRKLISLATPITLDYLPDLRQIGIVHNVISLADIIQGPASFIGASRRFDGKTLGDGKRVINHLATDNGKGERPSHSQLHSPATWLASLLEPRLLGPSSFPQKSP